MRFTELTDKVKEKARDKWREDVFNDSCDWEHVYNDAVEIGKCLGIEIDDRHNRTVAGQKISTPDISFSGFWSQGDGACWTGRIYVAQLNGALERLRAHVGNLNEQDQLYSMATAAERIYSEINAFVVAQRLDDDPNDDRYRDFGLTSTVPVKGDNHHGFSSQVDNDDDEIPERFENELDGLAEEFADWIYHQLEAEHDHLSSDEIIDEALTANEYDLDEDTGAIL